MNELSRREFLYSAAAGAALLAGQDEFGKPKPQGTPLQQVRFAGIGIGSQGGGDVDAVVNEGGVLVALCDVDQKYAAKKFQQYPNAKQFVDFRVMLDKMDKEIDAVVIGTPDHMHAPIAMEAMRRGKHVYCEKPLTHTIHDVRLLQSAAKKYGVVTQLGNQGHSFDSIRRCCELIWAGAIGDVHTIHAGCDAFRDVYSQKRNLDKLNQTYPIPEGLDYELWVGPAEFHPYTPFWVPWNWRGWLPYGTGCIGDWICHVLDPSYWALDLGAPVSVQAEVFDWDPAKDGLTYPPGTQITFEFPAKGNRGPVTFVWHDGSQRIPRPEGVGPDVQIPGTGAMIIGSKAIIRHGSHGAGGVWLLPDELNEQYSEKNTPKKLERVQGHHWDWLNSIKNGKKAGSDFSYGGPLTQVALIGAIAIRFPGEKLEWDNRAGKFKNNKKANEFINPPNRKGWKV